MISRLILCLVILPLNLLAAIDLSKGFADLIENFSPAVVNISTEQKVPPRRSYNTPRGHFFEDFNDLFDDLYPFMEGRNGGEPQKAVSLGSGFIVDKSGIIVTNRHVITFRDNELSDDITITFHDNRQLKAKVLGTDPNTDLAVLKVKSKEDLPYVEFGNSDEARVGDVVLAIGNAFGLGTAVSSGIVSAMSRNISIGQQNQGIEFIQTDAAINRGNSGGPLFDINGKVIGINFAIISPSGGNAGVGFAIPSNVAAPIVKNLAEGKRIKRAYIGIMYQKIGQELADSIGQKVSYGALVVDVEENSPAADAGIKVGDIILDFNGEKIKRTNDLPAAVSKIAVGTVVNVKIMRDYKNNVTLKIKLGERDSDSTDIVKEYKEFGMQIADVPLEIKKKYNVNGVMIAGVDNNHESSLRKGDIIERIGSNEINGIDDFDKLIKEYNNKNPVLLVNKNGKKIFMVLKRIDK